MLDPPHDPILPGSDLELVARALGADEENLSQRVGRLRADPELLARGLEDPRLHEAVLGAGALNDPLLVGSPGLVFAAAVYRTRDELHREPWVREWAGTGQRIPVFAVDDLRDFLEDRDLARHLVGVLASYTHVTSGSAWVQTRRGPRRRRFSELDLFRLASMLEATPDDQQAPVQRRLGDLSLFLAGVFPDHAGRLFRPLDLRRLAVVLEPARAPELNERLQEALQVHGGVGLLERLGEQWYRRAASAIDDDQLGRVAAHFATARRVLNQVTDRYLFPFRSSLFPEAA